MDILSALILERMDHREWFLKDVKDRVNKGWERRKEGAFHPDAIVERLEKMVETGIVEEKEVGSSSRARKTYQRVLKGDGQ